MSEYELSPQEELVVDELMPATTEQIASALNCSHSRVWDIAARLREKGLEVSQDGQGRYFVPGVHTGNTPTNSETTRITSESKAAITRKAKQFLAQLEEEMLGRLEGTEPAVVDGGIPRYDGNQDLIIHRTDDHFGEVVRNEDGDEVFNSEIAEARVRHVFEDVMRIADARRAMGVEFDTANLLLGGDMVTNEAIYEGQAHHIDENIRDQIRRTSRVYSDIIHELAMEFPYVQVVCTGGNHGEFRTGSASNHANADDILYDSLDLSVRRAGLDNVQVLQSDAKHYINFNIRDWNAHMRHGHDATLEHIGTSAGKQRWLQWQHDHGFEIAFRGHHHQLKEEPIGSGIPVFMGGTILPQTGFAESMAMSGRPASYVHGATDAAPARWTERVYLD